MKVETLKTENDRGAGRTDDRQSETESGLDAADYSSPLWRIPPTEVAAKRDEAAFVNVCIIECTAPMEGTGEEASQSQYSSIQ